MSYSAFAAKVSSLNEKYDESTVNAAFNPSNADGWDVRYVPVISAPANLPHEASIPLRCFRF